MKLLEEVRTICGHYRFIKKYANSKVLSPHHCIHKNGLCIGNFKNDCPLYALVKRK